MSNASRESVLVENIGVITKRLTEVAADIKAGKTENVADTLKAIGDAAQWLSKAVVSSGGTRIQPPSILPGGLCQPKLVPVPGSGSPK